MSRGDDIKRLILAHERRLQKLKEHPKVDPHILLEIEDIEAEIQRRQAQLEADNIKNKDKIKAVIKSHKRRLAKLKKVQARSEQQSDDNEIKNIKAEINRLQTESEKLKG